MSAQSDFQSGMLGFRLALEHDDLIDKSPKDRDHNLRAKTFRNGIAIVGFSVLEHFLRTRTGEVLDAFDKLRIPFDKLPDSLRLAATQGALKGIVSRMSFADDKIGFIQSETALIASTDNTRYKISKYALGFQNSNLSVEDVGNIMNTFGICKGWESISNICKALNLSIPDAKTSFSNACKRRHNAAHNINALVNPTDLESFVRESYAIAIGFDMLLSCAYDRILNEENKSSTPQKSLCPSDIRIRTLRVNQSGKWAESRVGSGKATKVANSGDQLWHDARSRAKRFNETLAKFDKSGYPDEWEFPFTII